jgi:flagellar hook-associated protein 1 FlgK
MPIAGILSTARSALLAHQTAMEVVGHNIANAETPGYSRQDVHLVPGEPQRLTIGNIGTGVSLRDVARSRDALLDQNVRAQSAPDAEFGTRSRLLARIESILGEPSDQGLASAFDAFWNSWSDLASRPANAGARTVVQQRAIALTTRFNSFASQLDTLAADTRSQVVDTVAQANRLATQIASINPRIVAAEAGGHTANDLRDERDRLIDELGALVPVTVIDRTDGSNQVMIGGRPLVDGSVARSLSFGNGMPLVVSYTGETSPLLTSGGTLGALIDASNVDIPAIQATLNQLAASLVADVNALHNRGWSPPAGAAGNWDPLLGPTGSSVDFFDSAPLNSTARTIRLSAAVAASANAIAAGDMLDAPGNNAVAIGISGLRDLSPSAPGGSFGDAYQSLVSNVAGATRAASDSATVARTLADQATAQREDTTGVSTDEELVRLMRHQQAYAAAAKVIQAAEEMMLTLLSLKS